MAIEIDPKKNSKNSINQLKKILDNKEYVGGGEIRTIYNDIRTQFKFTGQDKIPMNDIEARMMKGKKGNFLVRLIIYNPAVDYDTKMICALHVTQSPTDHYLLPEVADKAINNIGKVPTYMSADTIYLNQISLSYFVKQWNRMD